MRNMILIPLALLLPLLIGCDVKIDKKALLLRYDERTDTLEGIGINEGICAANKNKIPEATRAIIECLEGQRNLQFGPITRVNFDKNDFSDNPEAMWANRQVVLDSVEIYLDEENRLSGVQHFHVRQFSRVLSIINRCIRQEVLAELGNRASDEPLGEDDLDERSIELMLKSAIQEKPWLRLEGNELVGEIPMSAEYWETIRRIILLESQKKNHQEFFSLMQLILQMNELQWKNDALHLRLSGVITDVVILQSDQDIEYDDGLLHALEDAGYQPVPDIDETSVRSWLQPEEL